VREKEHDVPTTIRRIINITAHEFGLTARDLTGNSRSYRIAKPRAVCVLVARQQTKASFKQIGRELGGRDHSTIMHAKKRGHELIRDDEYFEAYLRIRDAARNTP
jgi:chromosomal replication initiator protein